MSEHIDIKGPSQNQAAQEQWTKSANDQATTAPTQGAVMSHSKMESTAPALVFWTDEVRAALGGVVSATVEVGRTIQTAKQHLGRGSFQTFIRNPEFPLDDRSAQMLLRIASHPVLVDDANHPDLPSGTVPLYMLSGLDSDVVESGLESGRVHPAMTVKQVKEFVQACLISQGTLQPPMLTAP
jgi:hypothetical protein